MPLSVLTRLLLAVLAVPGTALAQTVSEFDRLADAVNAGDRVSKVEWTGRVVQGEVATLTPDYVALARGGGATERFARADVREVSMRHHDGLQNGVAIGFGSVALVTCLAARSEDSAAQCGPGAVLLGGLGAGIGALVDAAVTRRVVVFRAGTRPIAVSVWPVRAGVAGGASIRW